MPQSIAVSDKKNDEIGWQIWTNSYFGVGRWWKLKKDGYPQLWKLLLPNTTINRRDRADEQTKSGSRDVIL